MYYLYILIIIQCKTKQVENAYISRGKAKDKQPVICLLFAFTIWNMVLNPV